MQEVFIRLNQGQKEEAPSSGAPASLVKKSNLLL